MKNDPVAYEFDCFRIDVATRQLLKDGVPVPLPAKVFDTLVVLVSNHPRVVGKEELIQAVWAGSFVSDDSIAQNISILRRALGDDPNQPRYVSTIARHGYRFIPSAVSRTEPSPEPVGPPARARAPVVGIVAFVAGVVVAIVGARIVDRGSAESSAPAFRFEEQLPRGVALSGDAAISPDGRALAYAAQDDSGVARIWVRQLDTLQALALPGTEAGSTPFWSPDGAHLGFRTSSAVKRVDLRTGTVRVVAPLSVGSPLGASWGPENVILYANLGKIRSVSASGSQPEIVMDVEAGQLGEVRWPTALPDGRHFLFFASGGSPGRTGTYLGTLGLAEPILLVPDVRAVYAPPGFLLYVRDRALMAQRFDASAGRLEGPALTIPGEVAASARISVSAEGALAITENTSSQRLAWVDRRGHELETVAFPGSARAVWLSPDDRQALALNDQGDVRELWLVDLARNVSTRIRGNATSPAWSPDGKQMLFTAIGGTGSNIYLRTVAGPPDETPWLKTNEIKVVNSWSPDGRFVVFTTFARPDQTAQDLWVLPTAGERTPTAFLRTKARESGGQVSPDGRWMAYVSDETGTSEVYVQSFPTPGIKQRISTGGGTQAIWRRDGHELFYLSAEGRLMAAPVRAAPALEPGAPAPLFRGEAADTPIVSFAAAADGQRFLVIRRRPEGRVSVLTNWEATLRP